MKRARGRILILAATVTAAILVSAQPAGSTHISASLLPDLVTKEPERFSLVTVNGERRMRFDNEVGDAHNGPLEIVTEAADSDCDGDGIIEPSERKAYQRIYQDSNDNGYFERGTDTGYTDVPAGCVAYHGAHDHIHYQDFASYVLVRLSNGEVVSSSSKVTFCIADVNSFHPSLLGSPPAKHYTSCKGLIQGLSVGWSDEYPYGVSGQHVVLNPGGVYVGNGDYCLISTADPSGNLGESNATATAEVNNAASIVIRLKANGKQVRGLKGSSCEGVGPESW